MRSSGLVTPLRSDVPDRRPTEGSRWRIDEVDPRCSRRRDRSINVVNISQRGGPTRSATRTVIELGVSEGGDHAEIGLSRAR